MEERYDILGKIGQGGLGAVYRAYDNLLNREVAIKRILPGVATDLEKEATRQLTKEAGALSALQHPHIVTIYDVGVDKDGSFVVMELLHGCTVDDVARKAVMTWADFREFAMQTQEALIAAQDMNLVHRDLKPANVMLTWLPSGKFQVKIVDFGLAKFTPKPSLQTIDQKDGIFGSIFFMAPEQFERVELDSRTDMYAIGCVYYYALTGIHPFDGETGPQVMASHLDHRVYPLNQLRPDLPRWVCEWIMWHINRLPEHRPVKARDALALFLQNEQIGDVAVAEEESTTPSGRRSLLIPGAAKPAEPAPLTSLVKGTPQPITPPENFGRPNVHTSSQAAIETSSVLVPAANAPAPAQVTTPPAPTETRPAPAITGALSGGKPRMLIPGKPPENPISVASQPSAAHAPATNSPASVTPAASPIPVAPAAMARPASPATAPLIKVAATTQPAPAASVPMARPASPATAPLVKSAAIVKPTLSAPVAAAVPTARPIPTATAPIKPAVAAVKAPAQPTPPQSNTTPLPGNRPAHKSGMNNGTKAALATVLGLIIILVIWMMINRSSQAKIDDRYHALVELAAKPTTKELPVNKKDLEILLDRATSISAISGRETIYKALYIAQSNDGTNVDQVILQYTLNTTMQEDIRENILRRVIGGRINRGHKDAATANALIEFVNTNPKPNSAAAALEALKGMAVDEHFPTLLNMLQFTPSADVRRRCEEILVLILRQSSNRANLATSLDSAYPNAPSPEVKMALLRTIAATGTDQARELILTHLKGSDKTMQIAAADASKNWPDDSLQDTMLDTVDQISDITLRTRLFNSCRDFLNMESTRSDDKNQQLWQKLAKAAKDPASEESVIRAIVANSSINATAWARDILKNYEDNSSSERVSDIASRALSHLDSKAESAEEEDKEPTKEEIPDPE